MRINPYVYVRHENGAENRDAYSRMKIILDRILDIMPLEIILLTIQFGIMAVFISRIGAIKYPYLLDWCIPYIYSDGCSKQRFITMIYLMVPWYTKIVINVLISLKIGIGMSFFMTILDICILCAVSV